jgi:hypothetical protein
MLHIGLPLPAAGQKTQFPAGAGPATNPFEPSPTDVVEFLRHLMVSSPGMHSRLPSITQEAGSVDGQLPAWILHMPQGNLSHPFGITIVYQRIRRAAKVLNSQQKT